MPITHILSKLVLSASSALVAFGCWKLGERVWHNLRSPLRILQGPKGTSWLYGNLKDIFKAENSVLHEQWVEQYGTTLKYKGFFFSDRLFTMDTRALNHVLTHSSDYQKPSQVRYNLSRILGEGVLFVEGAQHRQQRRIMNPAFGPAQIRALTDIFLSKSIKLRDIWSTMTVASEHAARMDIMPWLSKMTLDVIGVENYASHGLSLYDAQLSRATRAMRAPFPRFAMYTRARVPALARPMAPAIQKHPSTVHQAP
ncbi:cytochrome P450 [Suillus fuscotomentosus]|uniref:Cytochrome P450 n=1 Tax=Suillus fuscotomentosus TaxID=1912939 RepID=A0AAD4ER08_9AGAM|nr:cytochrome P450 [Suillus fuscotomentosus]KAG1908913.1 cytochrome P450 [Suillus fuscotomentosus]